MEKQKQINSIVGAINALGGIPIEMKYSTTSARAIQALMHVVQVMEFELTGIPEAYKSEVQIATDEKLQKESEGKKNAPEHSQKVPQINGRDQVEANK